MRAIARSSKDQSRYTYLAIADSSFRWDSHQGNGRSYALPIAAAVAPKKDDELMNKSAESLPAVGRCRRSLYQCKHGRRLLMEMAALQVSTCSMYKRLEDQ
jgi:hypothetical protein